MLVYVGATLIGVPGMPFTLLSPFLFGIGPAFVVMVVGSAISAALGFLIARYLARDALAERLAGTDGFARLSALVEEHDWAVIPVLRIVPIAPFAVVNYGFGLTGISFWRYFGWSELAMIPMNAVLVVGAGLVVDASTRGTAPGRCSAPRRPPRSCSSGWPRWGGGRSPVAESAWPGRSNRSSSGCRRGWTGGAGGCGSRRPPGSSRAAAS